MKNRSFRTFAVVAILVVAACSDKDNVADDTSTTSSTPAEEGAPTGDAFYEPPSPLPNGKPGDIIWSDAVTSRDGSTLHKVLYLSSTVAGEPTAVSGLIWVPDAVATDAPVLSYAHGTTGLGDQCAPSRNEGNGESASIAAPFLERGFIVVATDYEGSGTPGVHPYVVGLSEARSTLDIIRAARNMTETSGQSIVWGHSQGGGAALITAEIAPTYAPDTNVVGSVAGAPAVELKLLAAVLRTSPFFGYVFMAGAGFEAAYPDIDLSEVLTEEGLNMVKTAAETCSEIHDLVRGKDPALYIAKDPASVEPFATYLEANTPGNVSTSVPIFVYHGENDEQIPVLGSKLYLERACVTGGSTILRKTYPNVGHVDVITAAQSDIVAWIEQRLAGTPAQFTPCD
jgi:pimeloyl-ACP methyl ester carboxylesterase